MCLNSLSDIAQNYLLLNLTSYVICMLEFCTFAIFSLHFKAMDWALLCEMLIVYPESIHTSYLYPDFMLQAYSILN